MDHKITVLNLVAEEGENPVKVKWNDVRRWEVTNTSRFAFTLTNDHNLFCMVLDFNAVQQLHEEMALILEIEEDIRNGTNTRTGVGYFSRRRS